MISLRQHAVSLAAVFLALNRPGESGDSLI
ncbi:MULTISPECIES: copper transporter [unclassified Mycobacterium tuberculosis complex]